MLGFAITNVLSGEVAGVFATVLGIIGIFCSAFGRVIPGVLLTGSSLAVWTAVAWSAGWFVLFGMFAAMTALFPALVLHAWKHRKARSSRSFDP
jgi:hypothetical protein